MSPRPCFSGLYPVSFTRAPPSTRGCSQACAGVGDPPPQNTSVEPVWDCPAQPGAGQVNSGGPLPGSHPPPSSVFVLLTFLDSKLLVRPQGSRPWRGHTKVSPRLPNALWQSHHVGDCGWPACPPSPTEMTTDRLSHTQLAKRQGPPTRPHLFTLPVPGAHS